MKKSLNYFLVITFAMFSICRVSAQTQNYLTSSGNKLFDVSGDEVRLTGVNWFGFETSVYSPHGIWSRDMKSVLQQIKDMGFNTIRVPWCNEMLNAGVTLNVNSYGTDPYSGISPMNEEEATASTPIELLDIFVDWCQENDMKIVLDNHSRAADGFLVEGLWYTNEYSEERWINDWIFMAERYSGISAVVAMDLNNEPHSSTWGNSTPASDWNKAAERCGNAILEVNPDVLIIVEGVGEFEGNSYWWGGNLMGAEQYPIALSDPSKLMYSAHEYGPEVSTQDWFEDPAFPNNMAQIWNNNYDYLYQNNTSPIFVGEFGIKDQDAFDGIAYTWFTEFTDFMGSRYSWTFWSLNPNSGDTGGILQDDWVSVNQWKLDVLTPHVSDLIPNVVGGGIVDNENNEPVASFSGENEPCGDNYKVVFLNASSSTDPDTDTLTYTWDFGDGNTGSGEQIEYEYTNFNEDEATITLTVSDGELEDSTSQSISISEGENCNGITLESLVIEASALEGEAPFSIDFEGMASILNGTESDIAFTWDFDGNGFASGQLVTNTFSEEGVYNVTLTAETRANILTANVTITVNDPDVIIGTDSDLSINYRNGGSDPTDSSINPHMEIVNNGTSSVAYSDLAIRYWFTSEDSNSLNYWCDWAQLGSSNVQGNFGVANGMNYVEITFANGAGNLNANSNSGGIQNRLAKTNWSVFNENDDYSYNPTKSSFTTHEQVTLYQSGNLVWGIEPSNSALKTLSAEFFTVYPNPATNSISISNDIDLIGAIASINDLSGKEIKSVTATSNNLTIDVSELESGVYVLLVMTIDNNLYSEMIVIE